MKTDVSRSLAVAVIVLGVALIACSKLGIGKRSAPAASSSAAALGSAAAPADSSPVCIADVKRSWAKGVNRRTGLTATKAGDKLLVGFALGNRPHVMVLDPSGAGQLVSVSPPADSPLAKDIAAAGGERDLSRVSPGYDSGGRVTAYADYRDKYKSGQRHVSCGAVGSREPLVLFDGKTLVDESAAKKKPGEAPAANAAHSGPPPLAAAPHASAKLPQAAPSSSAVVGRTQVFKLPGVAVSVTLPGSPPPPSTAAPVSKPPAVPSTSSKEQREIRDCRTVVDEGGRRAWALGSELDGNPAADGHMHWKMRLLADAGGGTRSVVHEVELGAEPSPLETFDAPAAARLADGSYVLVARYRGSLYGWTLASSLKRQSGPRVYHGGYPTLAHFVPDALDFLLLVSERAGGERYELRFGRIDGQRSLLPATLDKPNVGSDTDSFAEPRLARAGNQRWISYQTGKRHEGELVIRPVDAQLASVGRSFSVTSSAEPVYESQLFALADGRLLVVYISDEGSELMSQVLSCAAKS